MLPLNSHGVLSLIGEIKQARVFQFALGALIVPVLVAILTNQSLLEFCGVYALSFALALALAWPIGLLHPFWPRLRR